MHRRYHYLRFLIVALLVITSNVSFGQLIPGVVASSIKSSLIPRDGLIAYYKCDESSGNLVDSYGGFTGTATALTYSVVGAINTAVTFNGTSSNVAIGSGIRPTTGLSVSFWFKSSYTGADQFLVCNHAWNTNWYGFNIALNTSGQILFSMHSGTGTSMEDKATSAGNSNGVWHHYVCTWNGTTAYVYIDNTKSTGTTYSTTIGYHANCNLHFGSNEEVNNSFYNGSLDEVYFYNRALTDSEVTLFYNKNPF